MLRISFITIPLPVFLALLLPTVLCAQAPVEKRDPQLKDLAATIVPEKNTILPGEPVFFTVTVKNNSKTDTAVYQSGYIAAPEMELRAKYGSILMPLSEYEYGPAPQVAPGGEFSQRFLLSNPPKQPGDTVITSHSAFKLRGGNQNPNDVTIVTGTVKITVLAADDAKMGAFIDELIARVATIRGSPDNGEQQDALAKLEAIDDERAIPALVKYQKQNPYTANRQEPGLAKFNKQTVQAAMDAYTKSATAAMKAAPAPRLYDPAHDPLPKMKDAAFEKAAESGDAALVRRLVLQGADIRPFAKSDALAEKYWAAPLDETAVSPDLTITVQKVVKKGEPVPIHIEFKNTGYVTLFYNPGMEPGYRRPAGLLLFDANKQCVGDLFESAAGLTLTGVGHSNSGWIEKGATRVINGEFGIFKSDGQDDITYSGITTDEKLNRGIVPGHYYLQVVYWLRSIAPPPDTPGTAEEKFLRKIKGRTDKETWTLGDYERDRYYTNPLWKLPLYRSNIVPIEVE